MTVKTGCETGVKALKKKHLLRQALNLTQEARTRAHRKQTVTKAHKRNIECKKILKHLEPKDHRDK